MPVIPIALSHHTYQVTVEPGVLDSLGTIAHERTPHRRCALLADQAVLEPWGRRAADALGEGGFDDVVLSVFQSGEEHKTLDAARDLYDVLLEHRMERGSPVIALGGGVTGDTVGFVASTYLRGVPLVQCPTTLLAMVDSSVGGKVGVNVPQGKNLIGSFYQPTAVVIDPLVLQTLPPRELRCGLAECVKHGVIRDEALFEWIDASAPRIQALDPETLTQLIARNVSIKAATVMADERETGERAHLNFGHTFAHAIEATAGYGVFHHGEAVSLGMVAAARMAADLNLCEASVGTRLTALLERLGLPVRGDLPATDVLMQAMRLDKKVVGDKIRFVLPERMGAVTLRDDVADAAVRQAWEGVRS